MITLLTGRLHDERLWGVVALDSRAVGGKRGLHRRVVVAGRADFSEARAQVIPAFSEGLRVCYRYSLFCGGNQSVRVIGAPGLADCVPFSARPRA